MIVEAVGNIKVNLRKALEKLAAERSAPPIERRIAQVRVVKKTADGTVIEDITVGDYR